MGQSALRELLGHRVRQELRELRASKVQPVLRELRVRKARRERMVRVVYRFQEQALH
jgi:hypothetical protein